MRKNGTIWVWLVLASGLLSSCNPAKRLEAGQFLLNQNEIIVVSGNKAAGESKGLAKIDAIDQINQKIKTEVFEKLTDELHSLVRQKPNRRMLFVVPFHLAVYDAFNRGKETKWKNWVKSTIGEAPVVYDSLLANKTREQFNLFMASRGYFHARVESSVEFKKNRTANAKYIITAGEPYTIKGIQFFIEDPALLPYQAKLEDKSLLKVGTEYRADDLVKERDRITEALRNEGFFFFSRENIFFLVDSGVIPNQLDIRLKITGLPSAVGDTLEKAGQHQKQYIHEVVIRSDFNPREMNDSVLLNSVTYKGIKITWAGKKLKIKPQTLHRAIFLRKGELYQSKNEEITGARLSDLGIFKFTSFRIEKAGRDSLNRSRLNCFIQLTPAQRQSLSYELEGTNTGGNLGTGGNISYRNKNLFRGAELLEIKAAGGFEAQSRELSSNINSSIDQLGVFNTIEIRPEISLTIPRFLVPFKTHIGKYTRPKSNLNLSYNHQQRPDYSMTVAKAYLEYQWNETQFKRWRVSPVHLSLVDIRNLSPSFRQYLESTSLSIRYAYQSHLVPAMRISYIVNTQDITRNKSFFYLRINLETAGNLFWAANKVMNLVSGLPQDVSYTLNYKGIDYSQFIRPDADIKYYKLFDAHNTLVLRLAGGFGLPYGNTVPRIMPFDKTFFAGGANDMRGWGIRDLGPGTEMTPLHRFEQTGEVKVISNLEYRFDLIKFLEGAIFTDCGNIWMRKDTVRPDAVFSLKNWKWLYGLGVDAGLGLRLNFSFFVLRIDYAVQLRNPSEKQDYRWVVFHKPLDNLLSRDYSRWQFGIGYPF